MHPLNAESIKFYCILMRAYFNDGQDDKANQFFSKALAVLEHHWGEYHPI
jgi:pentatricopeptide repeat protein